jgi:hypothetical protein
MTDIALNDIELQDPTISGVHSNTTTATRASTGTRSFHHSIELPPPPLSNKSLKINKSANANNACKGFLLSMGICLTIFVLVALGVSCGMIPVYRQAFLGNF